MRSPFPRKAGWLIHAIVLLALLLSTTLSRLPLAVNAQSEATPTPTAAQSDVRTPSPQPNPTQTPAPLETSSPTALPVAQPATQAGGYLSVQTVTTTDGAQLTDTIIDGPPAPPPGFKAQRMPVEISSQSANATLLNNVPAYSWVFGCSAVSAAMIAGYYDRNGYPNLYTGPTGGGVIPLTDSSWPGWTDAAGDFYPNNPLIASHNGLEGRSTPGSIDDYWVQYGSSTQDPFITNGWNEHIWGDAIGDFMKTSQSTYNNVDGSTAFYVYTNSPDKLTCHDMEMYGIQHQDGTYGRKLFYESRGYTVSDCYSQNTDNNVAGGFSLVDFKAEIDAGHPVLLNLAGHSVVGLGYADTSNTIYVHDTWDTTTHAMTWGGSYAGMQLLEASVVDLAPVPPPAMFSKVSPANSVSNISTSPTLTWDSYPGATRYEYCYDTSDDGACSGSWIDAGASVSANLSGLDGGVTYDWQVRARTPDGTIEANDGAWWRFTTQAPPTTNDDFDDAIVIQSLPYRNSQDISTTTISADDPTADCTEYGKRYKTVWYAYTAAMDDTLIVDTTGSSYTTLLDVWTGQRGSLSRVACAGNLYGGQYQVKSNIIVTHGTTYYIEVSNAANSAGSLVLNVTNAGYFHKKSPWIGSTNVSVNPTLTWDSSFGATSYDYCYDTSNDGACSSSWIAAGTSTSVNLSGLDSRTTYYWQVRAHNSGGIVEANTGNVVSNGWWYFTTGAYYKLTVARTGRGSGSVTSSPGNIDCGAACSDSFVPDASVTLTAHPSAASVFAGWTGAGCTGTGSCQVKMTAATEVTAAFDLQCFSLAISASPSDGGTVSADPPPDCNNATQYTYGALVTLTAAPNQGYIFSGWSGDVSGPNGPVSLTITAPASVTANFEYTTPVLTGLSPSSAFVNDPPFTLTVSGAAFAPTSSVRWDGRDLATTYLSSTSLTVRVTSLDTAGLFPITVFTPKTGRGTSDPLIFAVNNRQPILSSISPAAVSAGEAAFTLTVKGFGFSPASTLRWNGANLPTTFVSSNVLQAAVSAGLVASPGTAAVIVVSPAPGGGESAPATFKIASIFPAYGAAVLTTRPTLDWEDVPLATGYTLQVSLSSSFSSPIVNKTVTPSTYTFTTDLAPNKAIYWRVYPKGITPSGWSETYKFYSANPPGVPILNLPASTGLVTTYTPRLDWSTSSLPAGATFDHYQVQIATDSAFSDPLYRDLEPTDNTIANSAVILTAALPANGKYYWRVCAWNTLGQYSLWSTAWYFRTPLRPPELLAPSVAAMTTRPVFKWNAAGGASGYTVQVSTSLSFSSPLVNTPVSGTTYLPANDLPRSRTLYWRARANGTNPSNWATPLSFMSANPPAVPSLLSPVDETTLVINNPLLDWNDPVGADYYEVQIATDSMFSEGTVAIDYTTASAIPSSYTPSPALKPNRTYYWRVRVFSALGQYSNWSAVRHFHVRMPAPGLVAPGAGGTAPRQPAFTWDPVDEATGYVFQVSSSASFSSPEVNKTLTTGTTYTLTSPLSAGKKYYWRVYAKGTISSPWSAVWNFITGP